jgi:hypothetical protein
MGFFLLEFLVIGGAKRGSNPASLVSPKLDCFVSLAMTALKAAHIINHQTSAV